MGWDWQLVDGVVRWVPNLPDYLLAVWEGELEVGLSEAEWRLYRENLSGNYVCVFEVRVFTLHFLLNLLCILLFYLYMHI